MHFLEANPVFRAGLRTTAQAAEAQSLLEERRAGHSPEPLSGLHRPGVSSDHTASTSSWHPEGAKVSYGNAFGCSLLSVFILRLCNRIKLRKAEATDECKAVPPCGFSVSSGQVQVPLEVTAPKMGECAARSDGCPSPTQETSCHPRRSLGAHNPQKHPIIS